MTLSEFIIQYREKHDLSQRQFAKMCGLSNGYISMLEKNENPKTGRPLTPSVKILQCLATAMNMTLTDLCWAVDDTPVELPRPSCKQNEPAGTAINSQQAEVMHLFSKLSLERQDALLSILRGMQKNDD